MDLKWMLWLAVVAEVAAAAPYDPTKWEPNIAKLEAKDRETPPPAHATLFVGSSTIVGWDLQKYFPERVALNRGFGGSRLSDSVYFYDRVVKPYRAKQICIYAGDNDIGGGVTPEAVRDSFAELLRKIRTDQPTVSVVWVSIKPSIKRWALIDQVRQANALVKEVIAKDEHGVYFDTEPLMLGPDGLPRKEILKEDGLHLNADGYRLWSDALRPLLIAEPQ
ncbi:MAG: hypothetical protein IT204_10645 [Fimbriimonadaceae bacterium]|nr:hypothetical protein [Fimbriimonadaceae bacterium]